MPPLPGAGTDTQLPIIPRPARSSAREPTSRGSSSTSQRTSVLPQESTPRIQSSSFAVVIPSGRKPSHHEKSSGAAASSEDTSSTPSRLRHTPLAASAFRGKISRSEKPNSGRSAKGSKLGKPQPSFQGVEAASKKRGRHANDPLASKGPTLLPSAIPTKRGRPFKHKDLVSLPPPNPKYISFLCEWSGCPAELHNLETLQAHILTVHNKKQPTGRYACLWDNCNVKHRSEALSQMVSEAAPDFETKKEWRHHLNEVHLVPFAWHMGDGPRGTSLDASKDKSQKLPWLFKDGKQVTPSVEAQVIEGGHAQQSNRKRFRYNLDGELELKPVWRPLNDGKGSWGKERYVKLADVS